MNTGAAGLHGQCASSYLAFSCLVSSPLVFWCSGFRRGSGRVQSE